MLQEPRLLRLEVRGSPDNEIMKKMITEAIFCGMSSMNVLLFSNAMIDKLASTECQSPRGSSVLF